MITSVNNPRVKAAAALQRKKERDATGHYLIEGPNAVDEAVAEGLAEVVYATEPFAERYVGNDVEVVEVAEHVLERIATTRTPQGVVAIARQRPARLDEILGDGVVLVIDKAADPGNVGTIIRTADALAVRGVVLTEGSVDPFNPKAVRATTGSITRVPVVTGARLDDVIEACRGAGQRVLALDADAPVSLEDEGVLAPPVALVFGSEAHGLSADALEAVDAVVCVPRFGRAESLNLSVAVGVATYVAARATHGVPDRAQSPRTAPSREQP